MATGFLYELARSWPRLAWLAICQPGSPVRITHGPGVETCRDWFCEAVWDGPFPSGNFDDTDVVFGSGGRRREDGVIFVSSTATQDRLHAGVRGDAM